MQETWVQSLIWDDPLKKGMATHSSILAHRIPWTEEFGGVRLVYGFSKSQAQLKQLSTQLHFYSPLETLSSLYSKVVTLF